MVTRRRDPFLAYVVAFHLAWIAWPFVVYPRLIAIGETTLTYAIVSISLRLLIGVAPVVVYLRIVDKVDRVREREGQPTRAAAGA